MQTKEVRGIKGRAGVRTRRAGRDRTGNGLERALQGASYRAWRWVHFDSLRCCLPTRGEDAQGRAGQGWEGAGEGTAGRVLPRMALGSL